MTGRKKATAKKAAPKSGFKKNDEVSWSASQGTVKGKVERTLTKPTRIKTHDVAASPENPEVLVRSDQTGALAAHKPTSLRKRGSST